MPFGGFLRPKPDGGKKPMVGKQIITPGATDTPINFGFHDGSGYSSAVVVPVASVLAGTTIAGQAGTMPTKVGSATVITPSGADQAIPQGYYGGAIGDGKVSALAVSVGDNSILDIAPETLSNSLASYVKLKEISTDTAGAYRISFDLRSADTTIVKAKIYKNGVAYGTERGASSSTPTTYTEDLAFSAGDLIQIYAQTTNLNHYCYVSNVKIKCAIKYPMLTVNMA